MSDAQTVPVRLFASATASVSFALWALQFGAEPLGRKILFGGWVSATMSPALSVTFAVMSSGAKARPRAPALTMSF